MLRTHTCGELTEKQIGKKVTLCGWVDTRRDHGNLIFIDLRDRWGKTQVVFNPENKSAHSAGEKLRSEYVVSIQGEVGRRPKGTENPKLKTGAIEIRADQVEVLNTSETPPFEVTDKIEISEELRLKYRYLDLRRPVKFDHLYKRYQITKIARDYFAGEGFIEVETPMLTKSTPEGARDYLVPARLIPGAFYALPQSPQLFKQILMVSGFDRYFQLARCLRDEDLRADRQPEHTQIDVEMSFVTEEDIFAVIEGLLTRVVNEICQVKLSAPFQRMTYEDAMNRFGSDKPDLRYGLELTDLTSVLGATEVKVFREAVQKKGAVKGLKVSGKDFSLRRLDALTEFAKGFGAAGLAWFKLTANGLESPLAKFLKPEEQKKIIRTFNGKAGDTFLIVADQWRNTCTILGAIRAKLAGELRLINTKEMSILWVVDFPLLQWNDEEKRLEANHHPFTSPRAQDLPLLAKEPLQVKARAYDLVLNGTEIGGGSIRIHQEGVQKKVFQALQISAKDAEEKFGFLLKALSFGAPPHGGIAIGLDRLSAILLGLDSIREVIAFPKTQKGTCLLSNAPSPVYPEQLQELHLKSTAPKGGN